MKKAIATILRGKTGFTNWLERHNQLNNNARKKVDENPALVPATHNRDYPLYDWQTRHLSALHYKNNNQIDLVFVGDSILHRFGGNPSDDTPNTGQVVWDRYFSSWNPLNLGFGYDRTENVLWRIQHGELDGHAPRGTVLLIGTNNLSVHSVEQTFEGTIAVIESIQDKLPNSQVLVCGLLPRGKSPNDPLRIATLEVNSLLRSTDVPGIEYIDSWDSFIGANGEISSSIMHDFLHPTELGYQLLAEQIAPVVIKWFE